MRQNGRFCKSGFAALQEQEVKGSKQAPVSVSNQAICTIVENIKYSKGKRVDAPYSKADKYKSIKAVGSLPGDDSKLEKPFACDPTDSDSYCFMTFNTTSYLVVGTKT